MKITVIADNIAHYPFREEHGLALFVEYKGRKILFDCGNGGVLVENMNNAGIEFADITDIILSHGHYDHTGGLSEVLRLTENATVWSTSGINSTHYSCHAGKDARNISVPAGVCSIWQKYPHKKTVDTPVCIADGIWLSGMIPRVSGEDTGGPFFVDPCGQKSDMINDELALLLDNGTLIQGCCHAGIINTMTYFQHICPDISIKRIVGGLHLLHAGHDRLLATARFLDNAALEEILLLHCTGDGACEYLKNFLGCKVIVGYAGLILTENS